MVMISTLHSWTPCFSPSGTDASVWSTSARALRKTFQICSVGTRIDPALAMRIVQLDAELSGALVSRLSAREVARLSTVTIRGVKGLRGLLESVGAGTDQF